MNNPKIFGIPEHAIIGSDKIIFFVNDVSCLNDNFLFVVITYPESFAYMETEYDSTEFVYDNYLWYDNYKINYTCPEDFSKFLIQIMDINEKVVDEIIDTRFVFQFGDCCIKELNLSNGDILIQNFGDVYSTILFTKNKPKISLFSLNKDIYNGQQTDNKNCQFCKSSDCPDYKCLITCYYENFFSYENNDSCAAEFFFEKIQIISKQGYLIEKITDQMVFY